MELALCDDPVAEYSDADEPMSVRWGIDPLNDLRTAVDQFLDQSNSTEIAPRDRGPRPHVTTMAIRGVVHSWRTVAPNRPREPINAMRAPSGTRHRSTQRPPQDEHAHPDWHDRVSQIVASDLMVAEPIRTIRRIVPDPTDHDHLSCRIVQLIRSHSKELHHGRQLAARYALDPITQALTSPTSSVSHSASSREIGTLAQVPPP